MPTALNPARYAMDTLSLSVGGRPKVEEIVAYWPALIDKRVVQTKVEVM